MHTRPSGSLHGGSGRAGMGETAGQPVWATRSPSRGTAQIDASSGRILRVSSSLCRMLGYSEDELLRNWTPFVAFSLPDQDVFLINANANPPALAGGANSVVGVGTVLFNMAVRPGNGRLYVSNTEARNEVRFENFLDGARGVQGHIAESRITVVNGTTPT